MSQYNLKYVNDNIKLVLKFKGWTQSKLCEKTGISQITLRRRFQSNGKSWTMFEAVNVARALNIPVEELFFTRMVPNGNIAKTN